MVETCLQNKNISIIFLKSDITDVLNYTLKEWKKTIKNRKVEDMAYSFAYWLFRWSGLIHVTNKSKLNKKAINIKSQCLINNSSEINKTNQSISICFFNPEIRDIMNYTLEKWQKSVKNKTFKDEAYSFAYWLFELSGLIKLIEINQVI